ncbi:hypothetical protein Pve01_21410 [Planomonospora venezuelensis]|nr:CHAT domain-containing protein [Planomonospora venezuelensis]GIN00483.1 hypothetical protein Pve01_21410 [Planomonospora venezuelensis]
MGWIAATRGAQIELRVLQYGVTEERLRDVVKEDEGWDVVHVSGHGSGGTFLLEREDGSSREITGSLLAEWLEPLAGRVKLVTASACSSAALTAAEHLRLLGLGPAVRDDRADPAGRVDAVDAADRADRVGSVDAEEAGEVPALAVELVDRLGCAVVAMRFPVVDDFAVALSRGLYEGMVRHGQTLPAALATAIRETLVEGPSPECPALSAGTPALFGAAAGDLRLGVRGGGEPVFGGETLRMDGFPDEPERFVGGSG